MALIDVDRHILTELIALSQTLRTCAIDFKEQWEMIASARDKCELLIGDNDKKIKKLKSQMKKSMKICTGKMIVMDDAMSRQSALLTHMISEVKEADTGKGTEIQP